MWEILGWTLIALAWPTLGWMTAVAVGRVCNINVEHPSQRARAVLQRGARLDVSEAVRKGGRWV